MVDGQSRIGWLRHVLAGYGWVRLATRRQLRKVRPHIGHACKGLHRNAMAVEDRCGLSRRGVPRSGRAALPRIGLMRRVCDGMGSFGTAGQAPLRYAKLGQVRIVMDGSVQAGQGRLRQHRRV